ncbi:MAG: transposase, partial [Candidatus Omnitrophica bacterium]|nr:transposase [Candidatus Omnitrophota bacterium]
PAEHQLAYYGNQRRIKGKRGKALQRRRSELTERTFAHICETGGARRTWLQGLENVNKRYLIHVAARNLGLVMRQAIGVGTPRSLQKEGIRPFCADLTLRVVINSLTRKWIPEFPLAFRFGNVFASRTRFQISAVAW